jgi:hypothetical protein
VRSKDRKRSGQPGRKGSGPSPTQGRTTLRAGTKTASFGAPYL